MSEQEKFEEALKGFYIHLVAYVMVNMLLLFFLKQRKDAWKTPVYWGMGLASHAVSLYMWRKLQQEAEAS